MDNNKDFNVLRLLLFSPLITLFKLRLNSKISRNTLNCINLPEVTNIRHKYVKDKIRCIMDGSITKRIDSIPIKSLDQNNPSHNFSELRSSYVNPNCFELDHINGHFVGYNSTYDSVMPKKELTFYYNNIFHKFTFETIGVSVYFNMAIYDKHHKTIVKVDRIIMNFGNQVGDFKHFFMSLCFKEQVDDNIIFIGINRLCSNNKNKLFALIYNRTCVDSFSCITFDSNISDIWATSLAVSVSIINNKRILCISNQETYWDRDNSFIYKPEIIIDVYDINSRTLITQLTIIDKNCWSLTHDRATSLAFIGGYLVHTKKNNSAGLMAQTWINSNNWVVEETISLVVTNADMFSIKLIEFHDYLSAMVVTNHKKYPSGFCENCSADVYYF